MVAPPVLVCSASWVNTWWMSTGSLSTFPSCASNSTKNYSTTTPTQFKQWIKKLHCRSKPSSPITVPHINKFIISSGSWNIYGLQNETLPRRSDLLSYQINEIEAARLRPTEEAELQEERNRLANAEGLAAFSQKALLTLDEGNPETAAASDLMGQVVDALIDLARLDPSQEELAAQAQALVESLAEITSSLRLYQDTIEFNPRRLDQVEERLDLLHNLKRKYGASIEQVLIFADHAKQDLEEITHASERIEELEIELNSSLRRLEKSDWRWHVLDNQQPSGWRKKSKRSWWICRCRELGFRSNSDPSRKHPSLPSPTEDKRVLIPLGSSISSF